MRAIFGLEGSAAYTAGTLLRGLSCGKKDGKEGCYMGTDFPKCCSQHRHGELSTKNDAEEDVWDVSFTMDYEACQKAESE